MTSVTSELNEDKLKEILRTNGIEDEVSEILVEAANLQGECYGSRPYCVEIRFQDKSKTLNLFVKLELDATVLEKAKLFQKEATFLMEYIPEVRMFCMERSQEGLMNIYPKCYHGGKRMIVLENLKLDKGYELLDKMELQDLEATKMALSTLAKHHAISYSYMKHIGGTSSLSKRFPDLDLDFDGWEDESIRMMMAPSIEIGITINKEILQRIDNLPGKEEAIALFNEHSGGIWNFLADKMKPCSDDPIQVLLHGDYWNNNMMFHRDPTTNQLDNHIAVDFQAVRLDSPATDLGYFLYSSVKPVVRRANLQLLLQTYLDVLNETSRDLGHPTDLGYEALYNSYVRKFHFGFWFWAMFLSTKASHEVTKDFDYSKMDLEETPKQILELTRKWIDQNPGSWEDDAKKIVNLIQEYKSLI